MKFSVYFHHINDNQELNCLDQQFIFDEAKISVILNRIKDRIFNIENENRIYIQIHGYEDLKDKVMINLDIAKNDNGWYVKDQLVFDPLGLIAID